MRLYSNEIVFRGHPDKVCDQISDKILDMYLEKDKNARCAIEAVGGKGKIFITGEVTSSADVNIEETVRGVLKDVGYDENIEIENNLGMQSRDIAMGTNEEVQGAGDNGQMFGFACRDTKEYLPLAMVILQKFAMAYDELRKKDTRFLSDGKCEITGEYSEDFKLEKIKTFTICYQNEEKERAETDNILEQLAIEIAENYGIEIEEFKINPTGRFKIGGFEADTGLTGRKIVVDNYHSFSKVGGGAFSGKDPSKVDRSGAYKARKIAKEILMENKEYDWCEVQISYAIGISKPLSIYIKTDKGEIKPSDQLYDECSVFNIINDLNLKNIKYEPLSRYGHFLN